MNPQHFREHLQDIYNAAILTQNRKYAVEVSLLLIICIFLVNWISPQSNALYFLLIFPAILVLGIFLYLVAKIIQNPEYGLPVIAFMLPFERIGALTTSSFNIRPSQVFVVITFLALLFAAGFRLKDKIGAIAIKKDPSFLLLIIFALINIISLAIAPNKSRSAYVLSFDLFIFFVYIFIANLLTTKEMLQKTVNALLLVSLLVSLYGIFQFVAGMLNVSLALAGLREGYTKAVFGFPRVLATESEPQFWANFLLIPIALSFSMVLATISNRKQKGIKTSAFLLALAVLILSLINMLMTFSRGGWYASVIVIGIVAIFYLRNFINIKTILISLALAACILAGFLFVLNYSKAPLTLSVFTNRATSTEDLDRIKTMDDALHFYAGHEILGIGVGSFGPYEAPNIYQKPQAYGLDIGWRIVNNEYVEILAETGLTGFLAFIAFLAYVTYSAIRAFIQNEDPYLQTILVGLVAAFGGMLVQYWAFSTLYVMQVWFLFGLLAAVAFNIRKGIWHHG